jgi:NAD(P)-dependent dehydrogenase (short-subunit alcohol dehydrogenase family)
LALAERGARLILLGRSSDAHTETEQLLAEKGAEFSTHYCDFRDRIVLDAALTEALHSAPPVDVIIHNAATIERDLVHEMSDRLWDEQIEVNLTAPLRITRAFLPGMLERKSGRILFVSSISAVLGTARQAAYHAGKAGLLGAMKCLAEELSDTGVSTMALLPGSVDTRMLDGSGFSARMSATEVAGTLVFYALDSSPAHNGARVEMFGT